jgi:hypothetical protein
MPDSQALLAPRPFEPVARRVSKRFRGQGARMAKEPIVIVGGGRARASLRHLRRLTAQDQRAGLV